MNSGFLPLDTDILLEVLNTVRSITDKHFGFSRIKLIMLQLRDVSPRSLLNISLTSRTLHGLSRSLIYSTLCFTFNRNRRDINGRLIRRLLSDGDLKAIVRSVEIRWAPNANLQPGEGSKEDLELLGQVLPDLVELRTFIWDAQYPILSWLLEILRSSHPRCKLYIRHPPSPDAARTLVRLRDLPCLFSLDVAISPGQYQAFRELQRVLTTSPPADLALALVFYMVTHTMDNINNPLNLRSLNIDGGIGYIWRLPILWSGLHRLSFNIPNHDLPEKVPQFDRLKSLILRWDSTGNRRLLKHILQNCQQLEVLDLTGFRRYVRDWRPSLWQRLGKTLVKLRLCEHREPDNREMTTILSDSIMSLIARECPKLRSLGFDLDCDGGWASAPMCDVVDRKLTYRIAHPTYRSYLGFILEGRPFRI